MVDKISWDEIKRNYSGEWVELINYEWEEGQPYPSAGEIRVHAPNRKEFYQQANQNRPLDSAILFVGDLNLPLGVIHNNFIKTY